MDISKLEVKDHAAYKREMEKQTEVILRRIDDVFNNLVNTECYLDKYLPYNTFVQFSEIMHVALTKE